MRLAVRELLRTKQAGVASIAPSATVLDAIKLMSERHIGCLAVIGRNGRLAGIITERDCLWKTVAEEESPRRRLVKDKMTPFRKLTTITPENTVDECMTLITNGRHRHLLVLEGEKLVGLVSIGDVVKSVLDDQQATIQSLEKYIEGSL